MNDAGAQRRGTVPEGGAGLLTSGVRRRIVEHLGSLPRLAVEGRPTKDQGMTAGELGDVLGLHSTTVRFHLDQLVAAGLVTSHFVRRGGAGRPAKKYVVAEGRLEDVMGAGAPAAGPYKVLAGLLASAFEPTEGEQAPPTPEEAGREWVRRRLAVQEESEEQAPAATTGEWLGKMGAVVDLLEEWGYTPDLAVGGRDGDVMLTLHDCPFLDLARVHPAVVCGVHRGLLRGALEAAGESGARVSLRPFVDARTCHAVLVRGPAGDGSDTGSLELDNLTTTDSTASTNSTASTTTPDEQESTP